MRAWIVSSFSKRRDPGFQSRLLGRAEAPGHTDLSLAGRSTGNEINNHLLLFSLHPRLTLLLAIVDPQFLQQHATPIVARTIPSSHITALLQEPRQTRRRRSIDGVLIVSHGAVARFQLLHLACHGRLAPFLIVGAGDDGFVAEELGELAADGRCVVVAGDFVEDLFELDVAVVFCWRDVDFA